jgi:hypothetical protein
MSTNTFDTIMGDCAEFSGRNMIRITEDMFEQQCDEWAATGEPVDDETRELGMRGLAEYHKQALNMIEDELGDRTDRTYLVGEAWHACHPDRPNGWKCEAVKFADTLEDVQFGHVFWDFEDDLDDPSNYDWSYSSDDFVNDLGGPESADELFDFLD